MTFEKIFDRDVMSKRQRVEATLNHQPVDRAALHEQLSYNPGVIAMYTGKRIEGFDYTLDDICVAIQATMDMCFPPLAPRGTERIYTPDGFVYQNDNWTSWHVQRPFQDEYGARDWLLGQIKAYRSKTFDAAAVRGQYHRYMMELQQKIGQTVICNYSCSGFCGVFDIMGLEIHTFFSLQWPEVLEEYMELSTQHELRRIRAVADRELSPVILIPEDFSTKQGPIFSPEFLGKFHYPYIRRLAEAWHEHGITVLYHSDGNYRKAIPDLMACGMDGFYCLEPNCGMDVVELKKTWPRMVWAGGLDGVDLMERGTPAEVREEVHRHIVQTDVLHTGGMFVASSSEINPPIKPENFRAMVNAVGDLWNDDLSQRSHP